jgi:hypothetical protein
MALRRLYIATAFFNSIPKLNTAWRMPDGWNRCKQKLILITMIGGLCRTLNRFITGVIFI